MNNPNYTTRTQQIRNNFSVGVTHEQNSSILHINNGVIKVSERAMSFEVKLSCLGPLVLLHIEVYNDSTF